jgi:hypothetical protein
LKTKRQKIAETFHLLESVKTPLTEQEKSFLERHHYTSRRTILQVYDPNPEDEKLISTIGGKLPDLQLLIFESINY